MDSSIHGGKKKINLFSNYFIIFVFFLRWGVYGQLGHGDTENVPEPKLVSFFKYKV